jgi:pyridoxal phosphate enzyme (YggS family)
MDISANLTRIRAQIEASCQASGRDPSRVRLIAVSKVKPADMIEAAFAAGQISFGESYVQELREKIENVTAPVEWHFIGGLQSNKVKYLTGKVTLIHSVDRLSLAEAIDRQWAKLDETVDILIQVNVGEESTKAGATVQHLEQLIRAVSLLKHVRICGLMTLPPYFDDPEEVRPFFRQLRELAEQIDALQLPGVKMQELSMGMSHDFSVAIEEGATLVRVGTAIFGERYR